MRFPKNRNRFLSNIVKKSARRYEVWLQNDNIFAQEILNINPMINKKATSFDLTPWPTSHVSHNLG
jgi:hypothetical protein